MAITAQAADVTVFAAASLKNALDDAAKLYQTKTGDKVTVSYAASSALAKQIEFGAPADIFFSADLEWMDYLQEKKLIDVGSRHTLLGNTLVLVAPKDFTVSLTIEKNFPLFASAGCRRQARHGSGRQRAGRQIRQGGVDLSRRVGCGVTARSTSRECARRLGLRRPERGSVGIVYGTDAKSEPTVRVVGVFPEDSHPQDPLSRRADGFSQAGGAQIPGVSSFVGSCACPSRRKASRSKAKPS